MEVEHTDMVQINKYHSLRKTVCASPLVEILSVLGSLANTTMESPSTENTRKRFKL